MLHHHHVLASVSLYSSLLEALFLFAQSCGVFVLEVEDLVLVVMGRVGG